VKKEIVITAMILIIIIVGEVLAQNYTTKCVEETNQELNGLKELAMKGENTNEELEAKSNEIYNNWREKSHVLAYYLEHDELEKVDTQIQIITADYEAGLTEESIPEIEQAIYILKHIKEKTTLLLKNVF